ncbi:MAG: diguanylate cyclase, partial [Pseudomonadota bacterium]
EIAPLPLFFAQTVIFLLAFGVVASLNADRVGGKLDFGSGLLTGVAVGFLAVLWPLTATVPETLAVPSILAGPIWVLLLISGVAGGVVAAIVAAVLAAGVAQISGAPLEVVVLLVVMAIIGVIVDKTTAKGEPRPGIKQLLTLSAIGTIALLVVHWAPAPPAYPPNFDEIVPVVATIFVNIVGGCLLLGAVIWLDRRRRARAAALVAAKAAMDVSVDPVLWIDSAGGIRYANASASKLLGFTSEELTRRNLWDIEHNAGDLNASYKQLQLDQKPWPRFMEARYLAKSSEAISVEATGTLVPLPGEHMVCLALRPVGGRRGAGSRPATAASTGAESEDQGAAPQETSGVMRDPLTGLGTIEGLARSGQSIATRVADREIDNLAVAVVEIDNFKGFVDRRGLAMGDALLQSYARSLRQTMRQEDEAYRIGNQQFAILLPGRGEGAFDLLRVRFSDVLSLTRRAGFPEANAVVGFAALSEVSNDVGKAVDLAGERLKVGRTGFRRNRTEIAKGESTKPDAGGNSET